MPSKNIMTRKEYQELEKKYLSEVLFSTSFRDVVNFTLQDHPILDEDIIEELKTTDDVNQIEAFKKMYKTLAKKKSTKRYRKLHDFYTIMKYNIIAKQNRGERNKKNPKKLQIGTNRDSYHHLTDELVFNGIKAKMDKLWNVTNNSESFDKEFENLLK
jgi:hypothetical protein